MNARQAFNQAMRLHRAGDLAAAEAAYDHLLRHAPRYAAALQMHGVVLSQMGRHEQAVGQLERAARCRPDDAAIHHNLGKALESAGRDEDATRAYAGAVRLRPDFAPAHANLGHLHKRAGRLSQALACYERALALAPRDAQVLNNKGNVHGTLAQWAQAEDCLRRAVRLQPEYAEAHSNLGIVLAARQRYDEALACYERAIALSPDTAEFHLNRGNALAERGETEAAITAYRRASELAPDKGAALSSLGNAHLALGRVEAAAECYDRALALEPDDAGIHFNRALLWLLTGDYARGWPEYEWGLAPGQEVRQPLRRFTQPRWQGEGFQGETLLVYAEQGVGDTLQFLRFLPATQDRGGKVLVECQPGLKPLIERAGLAQQVVERTQDGHIPAAFDRYVPLMSLPGILGTPADGIPAPIPYLRPDPARAAAWHERLADAPGLKIGLVWAGNPEHGNDRNRSCRLARLTPLFDLPGVSWHALQKGRAAEQLAEQGHAVTDWAPHLHDWDETAAAIDNLDLVISVDSAVAHLSGALGTPVWILLPFAPDWRWGLERTSSPWYPSARLFRQPAPGAWDQVAGRVADALSGPAAGSG